MKRNEYTECVGDVSGERISLSLTKRELAMCFIGLGVADGEGVMNTPDIDALRKILSEAALRNGLDLDEDAWDIL